MTEDVVNDASAKSSAQCDLDLSPLHPGCCDTKGMPHLP